MLNLYLNKPSETVEHDVEKLFKQLSLSDTNLNRQLIKCIEQGEYIDAYTFKDRFGRELNLSDISTGCKAALCVANFPDLIIDTIECGLNAIDAIISLCNTGNTLVNSTEVTFSDQFSNDIDVMYDKNHFKTIDDLNDYIQN